MHGLNSIFRRAILAISLGALACGLVPGRTRAADLPFPEGIYPYGIVEQELGVILREYGQNLGVRVQVSPKIQGSVRGKLPPLTAKAFLEHLCRVYNIDWYFDGHVLYLTTTDESALRVLTLGQAKLDKLLINLKEASLFDPGYAIAPALDGKSISLAAPPRYVGLIEQNIAALNAQAATPVMANAPAIKTRVYRGQQTSVVEFDADGAPLP